jgi:hypothetical protein
MERLERKYEESDNVGEQSIGGRIILNMILEK